MHRGSKVIVSNSIGKSSHVVGRTTMLGICLWIRAVIWQGISGLDRWSNRLGNWKENWMRSGSKRNTPIDTVRTNQNQWQGLGNDAVMAAGHEKYERKGEKKTITCNGERDRWIRVEFKQLVEMQFYKARSADTFVNGTYLSNGWKMTVMFLAPGLHRNLVSPPSIRLSSAPPGQKEAGKKRLNIFSSKITFKN